MTIRLFLLSPDTVFAARVNQAVTSYPLDEVVFDGVTTGAYGDIEPGMTVLFGSTAGAYDYGIQRIRKAATSDTIYIGRSSIGKGIGEAFAVDDAFITVLNDYRVWAKTPFIDDDGTIYKDADLTVGTNTGDDIPPVANAGIGFAATIDSVTSKITASWDASTNSFAVADGATISSYAWDVDDGTITVGSSSTAAITATFPAGFRWVKLTVTDSNGNTHFTRMPVYARNPASDTSISSFQIESRRKTKSGQTISLAIHEEIGKATYPTGTLVMLWEDEPASASDRSHMMFIGWHHDDPARIDSQRTAILADTTLECLDVGGKLDKLPGFTQEVEASGSPTVWTEMKTPNMDKYLHYLLHWHSTALELADWTWTGTTTTYPFVILGSDGMSLFDQVEQRAAALVPDYHFTCNWRGQLQTIVDPMLQDTGDRTSTEQANILIDDWRNINWRAKQPTVHWHRGNAIVAHQSVISSVFCVAPGEAPGQGESEQEHGEQLAVSQASLNACEGHRYVRINSEYDKFTIVLSGSDDMDIDPADMTWVTLTITDAVAAHRGLSFANARGLPDEVNISYNHAKTGLTREVSVTWEKETSGYPATAYYPETSTYDDYTWSWGDLPIGLGFGQLDSGLPYGTVSIAAIRDDGGICQTADFDTASGAGEPTWVEKTISISGTPTQFVVNAYSPLYLGTGTSVNGWLSTTTGIYTVANIEGTPVATLRHSFANTTDGVNMDFSFGAEGWGFCVYNSVNNGVFACRTTDGGVTWAEAQIGTHYVTGSLSTGRRMTPALIVDPKTPGHAYALAWTITGAVGTARAEYFWETTDYGATWSQSPFYTHPGAGNLSLGFDAHMPYARTTNDTLLSSALTTVGPETLATYGATDAGGAYLSDYGNYGVVDGRWGYVSSPQDETYVAMFGRDSTAPGANSVIKTMGDITAAPGDWTVKQTYAAGTEGRVAIAGDSKTTGYAFGDDFFDYTEDFFTTKDSRIGNMVSSFGSAQIIGICGI